MLIRWNNNDSVWTFDCESHGEKLTSAFQALVRIVTDVATSRSEALDQLLMISLVEETACHEFYNLLPTAVTSSDRGKTS